MSEVLEFGAVILKKEDRVPLDRLFAEHRLHLANSLARLGKLDDRKQ